jgi:cobalt-zinc-cadmium efflux system protein
MCDSGRVSHDHRSHAHLRADAARADRRWLLAAFAVVVVFMAVEVIAGLLAHSLALITDAGHMITDAAALLVAVIASRIAQRPAQGAYTFGFARIDALSGQANGITLLLLALWFTVEGIRRLFDPGAVHGGVVTVVALVGVGVNLLATWLATRADRSSLNVRGVLAHLITDIWAFAATFVAGLVILASGWTRADAIASFVVAALMAWTGLGLVRAAGRVFLEAAPHGVDPDVLGAELAAIDGVAEVHDLHVWQIGSGESAMSAHVLVAAPRDCHEVSSRLRALLAERYGIGHVTLQADHADAPAHDFDRCVDAHGQVHLAPARPGADAVRSGVTRPLE